MNDVYFSSISKSCARLNPPSRPDMLPWSLNKVLKLASNIDNSKCSFQQLFRKTLFLVGLASGARLSEMAALSRDKGYVKELPSGELSLSPHLKFLLKMRIHRRDGNRGRLFLFPKTCPYARSGPC